MKIGNVALLYPTILAPLAGITNLAFRRMVKALGCGLVCTEMISAKGLVYQSDQTRQMLASVAEEKPLSVQLFGADAIRTIPLHGKFAVVHNDGWAIAIRSSMNLNVNTRIETVEISADPDLVKFLVGFTDSVFARSTDANFASQATEIGRASCRERV